MMIDNSVIKRYQKKTDCPIEYEWVYTFTKGKRKIEMHRQEVVQDLLEQLFLYQTEGFPLWNKRLISSIFQEDDKILENLILLPIVGADASFDAILCTHEGHTYLLIDLLNIADYTPILTQMHYILHNLIHVQLCTYLIQQRYPKKPSTFIERLESIFFIDGLAQYISWNEDIAEKGFQNASYEKRKERSFGLLYQAIQIEEKSTQKMIIDNLQSTSFWDQFPQAAGMFFVDDLYQMKKEKGLRAYYTHGPASIFSLVFQE